MPTKARREKMLIATSVVVLAFLTAGAWSAKAQATAGAPIPGAASFPKPTGTLDAHATLAAAAGSLGMPRTLGVTPGTPRLDAVNTIEFWASGTPFSEYHVALAYDPPGMRVELTDPHGNSQHRIEVVAGKYAWNESEIGGGLQPGKGTATPMMITDKERLLWLWTLPYGVVKAGLAAGDKAKRSTENAATVITFPLMGQLAGVTVKATLDAKNFVTKVETRADKPGLDNLVTETEYSDYADRAEILTDVQFPGHIVRKRGGKTVVDLQVKMVDANNPYVVFPIPNNVINASAE